MYMNDSKLPSAFTVFKYLSESNLPDDVIQMVPFINSLALQRMSSWSTLSTMCECVIATFLLHLS